MWIVHARSCEDCDSEEYRIFTEEPTAEEIKETEEAVGTVWCKGMWCVESAVVGPMNPIGERKEEANEVLTTEKMTELAMLVLLKKDLSVSHMAGLLEGFLGVR